MDKQPFLFKINVKKIVEAQGGRIWLESRAGQGATFHSTWVEVTYRMSEALNVTDQES